MNLVQAQMAQAEWQKLRAELVEDGALVFNPDGTATYTLAEPFDDPVNGGRLDQVTMKRFKGKHLRKLDNVEGEAAKLEQLLTISTGLDPVTLGELDGGDYLVCAQVAADFTERRRRTGPTPSA